MEKSKPLADLLRPASLGQVAGQEHILAPGAPLHNIITTGSALNIVFYGPPGTGKTTVANIAAEASGRKLMRLNATTAATADIKKVREAAEKEPVVLYLDEVQYFSKKQQQTLLECVEDGRVCLVASTTENPYFYVYGALLSRCLVFEFKPVSLEGVERGVEAAAERASQVLGLPIALQDGAARRIALCAGGDMRKAVNILEAAISSAGRPPGAAVTITPEQVDGLLQNRASRYDRGGDETYDLASGLHKSMRGSDPDAALYYLARFLEAGDILTPSRRILCCACEDVGLAYPQAIAIADACINAANRLGLPEAQLPLAQAVLLLATAPKSGSVHEGIGAAWKAVKDGLVFPVPRNLQNVHADTTFHRRAQDYKYPHDYPGHWVAQQYLPEELAGTAFYAYGDNPNEQRAKAYWDGIKRPPKDEP